MECLQCPRKLLVNLFRNLNTIRVHGFISRLHQISPNLFKFKKSVAIAFFKTHQRRDAEGAALLKPGLNNPPGKIKNQLKTFYRRVADKFTSLGFFNTSSKFLRASLNPCHTAWYLVMLRRPNYFYILHGNPFEYRGHIREINYFHFIKRRKVFNLFLYI